MALTVMLRLLGCLAATAKQPRWHIGHARVGLRSMLTAGSVNLNDNGGFREAAGQGLEP